MQCQSYAFSSHAIKRMFERGLSRDEVVAAIEQGQVIKDYPADQPYPSCLILWFLHATPIHVVVARNEMNLACYIVTAYVPSEAIWQAGFKEKKP